MKQPKKFVGLHSHSTFSIGDAIGNPSDHIDFAIENEMDALALTDHGNMNGYSHQFFHLERLRKKGVNFKGIPGVEAYFVESLSEWQRLYKERQEQKRLEKEAKKAAKKGKSVSILDKYGNELAGAKEEVDELMEGGTVVEDETTSKHQKWQDPLRQRNHLVLLPKNNQGLKDLFNMISLSYLEGFYRYPRVDLDMLKKYSNGNIIALSACVAGVPSRYVFKHQVKEFEDYEPNEEAYEAIQSDLKTMVHAFQDALGEENYYLELQFNKLGIQHLANMHMIECSKRTSAPLVVTCDAHYSRPEHWREREIYKIMAWASKTKGDGLDKDKVPKKIDELKCELYPKNAEQIWNSYKETTKGKGWDFYNDETIKNAIEQSWVIAHEQIEDIQPDRSVKLPSIKRLVSKDTLGKLKNIDDENSIAFSDLKNKAIKGLIARNKHEQQEYIDRLKHELEVVRDLKFAKYFLTYAKIMELANEEMLIGNARGSAGGSLLSYVLNITQVDPIAFGLLFERFLTKYKKGFPDIDSDFSDRIKATDLLCKYFGDENVIGVSNFNQLQMRSLIKDVARLNGIPFEQINKYTKLIEQEAKAEAKKQPGFDAAQWVLTFDEAASKSKTFRKLMEEYPDFENTIKVLFKQMRNVSRHAGGVIITDNAPKNMPIIKSGGVLQTPWPEGLNFRHLESFGMLKFDILGLGTLRMFEDTIRRILKKQGHKYVSFAMIREWFYENLHPDNNTLDDIKVYKNVYWEGRWGGIFQFVQPPSQKFIQKMKPRSIIDIATATSIFRPGPLSIKADRLYLKNRKSPKKISYKHPLLEEVLSDTYGLIVFQEQLQLIYHKLAGVPLDQTDSVRKAFTKKDISNRAEADVARQKLREEFADGCEKANGIEREISYDIFDEMEKFVAYSFNKAHATAYAITSYQCAWLLTYYPDEWICSYIDYCVTEKGKVTGKEDPKAVALTEAKALGYEIGNPDINLSEREFTVKDNVLIPSFASLKHCGVSVVREIISNRPYKTIEDLLYDEDDVWKHSKFNKRALATLVKLGAFDSMNIVGNDPDCIFKNYRQMHEVVVERNEEIKRATKRKKKGNRELLQKAIEEVQDLEDWSLEEKIKFSKDLSGSVDINLVVTPEIRNYFDQTGIKSIDQWENKDEIIWAVVTSCKVAKTRTGRDYLRLTLLGEGGGEHRCFVWNFRKGYDEIIPDYTLVLSKFKNSDFGFSTNIGIMEALKGTDNQS